MATPPIAVSIRPNEEEEEEDNKTRSGLFGRSFETTKVISIFPAAREGSFALSFGVGVYLSSLIPRDTAAAVVTLRPSSASPPSASGRGRRSVCWPAAWHLAAAAAAAKAAA